MALEVGVHGLGKTYPGVRALEGIDLTIVGGRCHGLVGENGAGKSTLAKILAGLIRPDEGRIEANGMPIRPWEPGEAIRHGLHLVHQELLFWENLTVAENMCLDDLPCRLGFIDRRAMEGRSRTWLAAIGAEIDESQKLGDLPVSRQQLVQIAAAIGRGAKVLIFDEPTSALSQADAERLFAAIQDLKAKGVACLYVSHRLDEIFAVCDDVTVLRDGRQVATRPIVEFTRASITAMMVGRELTFENRTQAPATDAPIALEVDGLAHPDQIAKVSFSVRRGEIVGLAGLVGAGRTEVAETIFGLRRCVAGTVRLHGRKLTRRTPLRCRNAGLGLVPEDRKRHGLVLSLSAQANVSLTVLERLSRLGFLSRRRERALAMRYFDRLRVRAVSPAQSTLGLSGGNQQKLSLARWLAAECSVLIVDEPTRGVDVGAKAEIYDILRELAASGVAILLISSELPELLALCTRILVMRIGAVVAEEDGRSTTESLLMNHMAGIT